MVDTPSYVPFPSTHWSMLKPRAAGGETPPATWAGLQALGRTYWKPIYAHFRVKWRLSREDAEEATQDFFLWVMEGPFLDRAEPGKGRFRSFVRAHLDHFQLNRLRAGKRQKRGGGNAVLSLDFGEAPDECLAVSRELSSEEAIDRQWRAAVLEAAVERLRKVLDGEGKGHVFEAFRRFDLAGSTELRPTQAAIAQELGISADDVENALALARRRLYQLVTEVVAESVDSPAALQEELQGFFPA